MAKGMPILGKDPLGKAKYANVTESGDLRVQLSGNIIENIYAQSVALPAGTSWESSFMAVGDIDEIRASVVIRDNRTLRLEVIERYGSFNSIRHTLGESTSNTSSLGGIAKLTGGPSYYLRVTNTHPNDTLIRGIFERRFIR